MEKIDNDQLEKISGGGISWVAISLGITAFVVFLSGVIEGYTNPGSCGC